MKIQNQLIPLLLFIVCCLCSQVIKQPIDEQLRTRIKTSRITIDEEIIHAPNELQNFYKNRTFVPAWTNNKGDVLTIAYSLVGSILLADKEGLNHKDYHFKKIINTIVKLNIAKKNKEALNVKTIVDLELLLTDAFLVYGSHLLLGHINPETIDPDWSANRRNVKMEAILQTALDSRNVVKALNNLLPPQKEYNELKKALVYYKNLAEKGGWERVPVLPNLQKGDKSKIVLQLKKRLSITGEYAQTLKNDSTDFFFDDSLESAVKRFQYRHGLESDGVLGYRSFVVLNTTVEDRINQIKANLERWRWLPQDLGSRNIQVNIPDFSLKVEENQQSVLDMKVIVGKLLTKTPVFTGKMNYLVVNPYWNLPRKITVKEVLPKIKANSNYLKNKEIKLLKGYGENIVEVDPETIDWKQINSSNFTYWLRQEPGKNNPLGKIKFIFPNRFEIYLHDTQAPEQFKKHYRGMSHGCIRVEKPLDLALYLLKNETNWTKESLLGVINKKIEKTVILLKPIAVHILYFTSWIDSKGVIRFRNDIYGKDKMLYEALQKKPSTSKS